MPDDRTIRIDGSLEGMASSGAAQAVITERLDALAAERARPWWRLLAG